MSLLTQKSHFFSENQTPEYPLTWANSDTLLMVLMNLLISQHDSCSKFGSGQYFSTYSFKTPLIG